MPLFRSDEVIKEEATDAEAFQPALTTLYLAARNDHDAKLQQQGRLYSDGRLAAGTFAVELLFWEDVVSGLALNPAVFKLHYGSRCQAFPIWQR